MNNSQIPGRYIIVGLVLFLAVFLPIAISISYFQDRPGTSAANDPILSTSSATPGKTTDTPRPPQPTKTVRNAEQAQGDNCTYPAVHWLVSSERWPEEIAIGNLYYTQEQAIEFVTAPSSGVFKILFIQLHAAYLNILSGASQSQIVEPMLEASDWLNKSLYGSTTASYTLVRGLELAKTLQEYNDGEIGPGRCMAYTIPLSLISKNISAAVLSLTPDIRVDATQTIESMGTPMGVTRTPASTFPVPVLSATRTPTRSSGPGGTPIPPTPIPTRQYTATQIPPTTNPTLPPTPRPTSPPPSDTPRPVVPTPTSPPPEEPTPTSPPP